MAELRCVCDEIDPSDRPCLVCECATSEIAQLRAENEQLRAENARLREAMPTDGDRDVLDSLYRATVELVTGGGMFHASARAEDELAKARAWIARLDAAKGVR